MRARLLAPLLCIACWIGAATCTASAGIDYSDMWWNPAEPGWGMSVHQQGDVLFAGMLVYGTAGSATWYTATAFLSGQDGEGNPVYSGDLYLGTGTRFDAPFDVAAFALRRVGSMTFALNDTRRGMLTYTIDAKTITKAVERQTWRRDDFSGLYVGALAYDINPLHGPCIGGHRDEVGAITVTHGSDESFSLLLESAARRCTYAGTYLQSGRLGSVSGNFSCSDGSAGSFTFDDMQHGATGITGRLHGTDVLCEYVGQLGAAKR